MLLKGALATGALTAEDLITGALIIIGNKKGLHQTP